MMLRSLVSSTLTTCRQPFRTALGRRQSGNRQSPELEIIDAQCGLIPTVEVWAVAFRSFRERNLMTLRSNIALGPVSATVFDKPNVGS